jgi:hypothetical protein
MGIGWDDIDVAEVFDLSENSGNTKLKIYSDFRCLDILM